jgi:steroid Delta-isomerase
MDTTDAPRNDPHPARAASHRSVAAATAGDREAWLACFAPDATVEDPVGISPLDPTGEGHQGREAIAAFWDESIAPMQGLRFEIHDSFACANEVVNVATIHLTLPDGSTARTDGAFHYTVDDAGQVTRLRAFWELERMLATLQPADHIG